MRIAYVVFEGITWLDFVGVYDPVCGLKSIKYLPDLSWDTCALKEVASDNFGLSILANKVNSSLKDYDVVIIPGGLGTRKLLFNQSFINWVKTANDKALKISICTGNLIFGAQVF